MGSKCAWVKLFFMFVLLEKCCSEGCWEQERLALLQLKHFFNFPRTLTDWVEGDENSDCCQWEGVECNDTTGRVMELHLSGTTNWELGEWYLNASLFTPFQELEFLDISQNFIAGCIENEGLERLSKLNKLKVLHLGINLFNNSILSSLKGLSSLENLYLNDNRLKGTIDFNGFGRLTSLKELDLSSNQLRELNNLNDWSNLKSLDLSFNVLNRSIFSSLKGLTSLQTLSLKKIGFKGTFHVQVLGSLHNLEELDMSDNVIEKFVVPKDYSGLQKLNILYLIGVGNTDGSTLLQSIRSFSSLKTLFLRSCNFTGTAFAQGLCGLVHLEELYIDSNHITGGLPWCLANMTSLRVLDLSYSQLTGNISSSPLVHLTSIQELLLLGNHFQIPISLQPFFNHSKLKRFDGEVNQIHAKVESYSLAPRFQLNSVTLYGSGEGGTFPKFLYHQHDLREVYLSHMNLGGQFPNWLLENNTKLNILFLVNNSLAGTLQMPIHSHSQLMILDVSNNCLQGHIPVKIGEFLPSLMVFNISKNAFNGSIPSSFGNMSFLLSLDLSDNQLTGEIPEHLATGFSQLQLLVLSNNNLGGHIFSKSLNMINLLRLQLDGNHFVGEIPESLSNSSLLVGLYLSDNHLLGRIPSWLGNLSYLQHITMSNNHLEGPIPTEFCQLDSLEILDLSENNLSGNLPSCLGPSSIKQIHLSKNMLQGQLRHGTFYNSSSMVTLDLSYNYLSGSIPNWIDKLSQLSYLILSNNNLEGEVPVELCRLNALRLIDLSQNNLSGQILSCLGNLSLHESYYTATTPASSYNLTRYTGPPMEKEETVQFTTKEISYSYRGRPLESMFGVDLSCNNLVGQIPSQIGYLTRIRALNLSHNNLNGTIPETFSNLKQLESLDLSYNYLNGKIPPHLVELNALAVFSVANNNLSGKLPEWTAQFATFNENSYEGNPLLCGLPLPKNCNEIGPPPLIPESPTGSAGDNYNLIDMDSFYITFTVSYVTVVLGSAVVLCVNPYWRRRWLYHVETWMDSCYYFAVDNLPTRFSQGI